MGGVGDAMRRAKGKVRQMRDKADAMDGMTGRSVLSNPPDSRSGEPQTLKAATAITPPPA
ncbi:MAG: hypothetical protein WDN49_00505 [Acetobacteraceae bacterium]